jgi:hypothetical protein
MEDLKNECKWNRSNGIPGMAGSEKGTAEYGRKKFYGAGEQCSKHTTAYDYYIHENG